MSPKRENGDSSFTRVRVFVGIYTLVTVGCAYISWGNLAIYVISYLHIRVVDETTELNDAWLPAVTAAGWGVGMLMCHKLTQMFSTRLVQVFASLVFCVSVAATYFTIRHSYYTFILTYGIITGISFGMLHGLATIYAIAWSRHYVVMATTFITVIELLGGCAMNMVFTWYINPDNLSADVSLSLDGNSKIFSQKELLDRVPDAFILYSAIAVTFGVVAFCLIKDNPSHVNGDSRQKETQTVVVEGQMIISEDTNQQSEIKYHKSTVVENNLNPKDSPKYGSCKTHTELNTNVKSTSLCESQKKNVGDSNTLNTMILQKDNPYAIHQHIKQEATHFSPSKKDKKPSECPCHVTTATKEHDEICLCQQCVSTSPQPGDKMSHSQVNGMTRHDWTDKLTKWPSMYTTPEDLMPAKSVYNTDVVMSPKSIQKTPDHNPPNTGYEIAENNNVSPKHSDETPGDFPSTHEHDTPKGDSPNTIHRLQAQESVSLGIQHDTPEDMSPCQVLKSRTFYVLLTMIAYSDISLLVLITYYKRFGMVFYSDDHFLSSLSIPLTLGMALSVNLAGIVCERFDLKKTVVVSNSVTCALSGFLYVTALVDKWLYLVEVMAYGCWLYVVYSLFSACVLKYFGKTHATTIIGMSLTFSYVTNVGVSVIVHAIVQAYGWLTLFTIIGIVDVLGFCFVLIGLPDRPMY